MIYLIPEATLHLQLTHSTHIEPLKSVCTSVFVPGTIQRVFRFSSGQKEVYTGSPAGDLILPSPKLSGLIPQGQATCPHVHTHHLITDVLADERCLCEGKMGDIGFQMDQG